MEKPLGWNSDNLGSNFSLATYRSFVNSRKATISLSFTLLVQVEGIQMLPISKLGNNTNIGLHLFKLEESIFLSILGSIK